MAKISRIRCRQPNYCPNGRRRVVCAPQAERACGFRPCGPVRCAVCGCCAACHPTKQEQEAGTSEERGKVDCPIFRQAEPLLTRPQP